jgi:hypothetical protein
LLQNQPKISVISAEVAKTIRDRSNLASRQRESSQDIDDNE